MIDPHRVLYLVGCLLLQALPFKLFECTRGQILVLQKHRESDDGASLRFSEVICVNAMEYMLVEHLFELSHNHGCSLIT